MDQIIQHPSMQDPEAVSRRWLHELEALTAQHERNLASIDLWMKFLFGLSVGVFLAPFLLPLFMVAYRAISQ